MNEQQNEWERERREEGEETIAYITPQMYYDIGCGQRYFKQNALDCQELVSAFYFLS